MSPDPGSTGGGGAIPRAVRTEILLSALGVIRATGTPIDVASGSGELRRLIDRYLQNYQGLNFRHRGQIAGAIAQANRIYQAGDIVSDDTTGIVSGRILPVDPTIRPEDSRYRYRVSIQYLNPDGTVAHHQLVVIDTDEAVAADWLHQRARDAAQGLTEDYVTAIAGVVSTQQYAVETIITTAGKRA